MVREEDTAEYHFQQLQAVLAERLAGAKALEAEADAKTNDAKAYSLRLQDKERQLKKQEAQLARRERNWEAQRSKEEKDLHVKKKKIEAKQEQLEASQEALQKQQQRAQVQLKELKCAGEYVNGLLQEFDRHTKGIRNTGRGASKTPQDRSNDAVRGQEDTAQADDYKGGQQDGLPPDSQSPRVVEDATDCSGAATAKEGTGTPNDEREGLTDSGAAAWLFGEQIKSELESEDLESDAMLDGEADDILDHDFEGSDDKLDADWRANTSEAAKVQSEGNAAAETDETAADGEGVSPAEVQKDPQKIADLLRKRSQAFSRSRAGATAPLSDLHNQEKRSQAGFVSLEEPSASPSDEKKEAPPEPETMRPEHLDAQKPRRRAEALSGWSLGNKCNDAKDTAASQCTRDRSESPAGSFGTPRKQAEDWSNPPAWDSDPEEHIPLAKRRRLHSKPENQEKSSKAGDDEGVNEGVQKTETPVKQGLYPNGDQDTAIPATANTKNTKSVPAAHRSASWNDILRRSASPECSPRENGPSDQAKISRVLAEDLGSLAEDWREQPDQNEDMQGIPSSAQLHDEADAYVPPETAAEQEKRRAKEKRDRKNDRRREVRARAKALKAHGLDYQAVQEEDTQTASSLSNGLGNIHAPGKNHDSDAQGSEQANANADRAKDTDLQSEEFISVEPQEASQHQPEPTARDSQASISNQDYWDQPLGNGQSEDKPESLCAGQPHIPVGDNCTTSGNQGEAQHQEDLPMPPPIKTSNHSSSQRAIPIRRHRERSRDAMRKEQWQRRSSSPKPLQFPSSTSHPQNGSRHGPSMLGRESREGKPTSEGGHEIGHADGHYHKLHRPHPQQGGRGSIPSGLNAPKPLRGKPARGRGRGISTSSSTNSDHAGLDNAVEKLAAFFTKEV